MGCKKEKLEDIPVAIRNKLYQQFSRTMEKEIVLANGTGTNRIPVAVLERYEDEKDCRAKQWLLFKEFMKDPSFLTVVVSEKHRKENLKTHSNMLHWRSRYLIELDYQAHKNAKGMKMADNVCRTAVTSQQDKDHPDDPDWMLYLIKKEEWI